MAENDEIERIALEAERERRRMAKLHKQQQEKEEKEKEAKAKSAKENQNKGWDSDDIHQHRGGLESLKIQYEVELLLSNLDASYASIE